MLCHGVKDDDISNQKQSKKSYSTPFLNDRVTVLKAKNAGVYRVSLNRRNATLNSPEKVQSLSGLSSTVSNSNVLNKRTLRSLGSEDRSSRVIKWIDQQRKVEFEQEHLSKSPIIRRASLFGLTDIEGEDEFYRDYCAVLVGNRDSSLKTMAHSFHDALSSIASSKEIMTQPAYIASTDKGRIKDMTAVLEPHSGENIRKVKVILNFIPSAKAWVMPLERGRNGQYHPVDGKCCFQKTTEERNEEQGGVQTLNTELR